MSLSIFGKMISLVPVQLKLFDSGVQRRKLYGEGSREERKSYRRKSGEKEKAAEIGSEEKRSRQVAIVVPIKTSCLASSQI